MRANRFWRLGVVATWVLIVPCITWAQPPSGPSAQPTSSVASSAQPIQHGADRSSDVTEIAKTLKLGEEAYENGRFQQAYEYFLKAWAKKKTYDVASFLGASELRLNLFRDAAEHLAYALRLLPPTTPLGPERLIREKLAAAKSNVGTLRIRTNVSSGSLKVDGHATEQPPTPDEIYVEPGIRTFELSARGYESTTRTIDVTKGDSRELTMELTALKAAPRRLATSPAGASGDATSDADVRRAHAMGRPSYVPAFITGGLTIVAGAAGVVFALLSGRADDDAGVRRTAILAVVNKDNPCDAPDPMISVGCSNLQTVLDDRNRFHNLALGSFIGAGAAALATGYFVLRPPKTTVGAAPMLSPRAAGLMVHGEW